VFEKSLYGDCEIVNFNIFDVDFWVDRIVAFPALRPLLLDKIVGFCVEYCKNLEFCKLLLTRAIRECPVLIFRLYYLGIYTFEDIEKYLKKQDSFILSYYFRKEIKNFDQFIKGKIVPNEYSVSFFHNEEKIDQMKQFGFVPSSIEYCLKYDDIQTFRNLIPYQKEEVYWSPFEWSFKPRTLDILSVCVFFGSVQCFKFLLFNDYKIDNGIGALVVCSGNTELYHLCNGIDSIFTFHLLNASEFCNIMFSQFFIENRCNINCETSALKNTPLHIATKYGHLMIVELLISNGANVNALNSNDI